MPKVQYTRRAELDFDEIAAYTLENWGAEQLVRYLDLLQGCCELLADDTSLGRIHTPKPQYCRIEVGKHVVFFRRQDNGDVLVARVLHQRMLPELHLGDP